MINPIPKGLIIDFDYSVGENKLVTFIFRRPHRIMRRINSDFTERLIHFAGLLPMRYVEYFAEGFILKYGPSSMSLYVHPATLNYIRENYGIGIGIVTRGFGERVKELLYQERASKSVDFVIGRENVGIRTIIKEHIAEGIKQLHSPPELCIVTSDSPSDLEKGRYLGAKTCRIQGRSYHHCQTKSDYVSRSVQAFLTTSFELRPSLLS